MKARLLKFGKLIRTHQWWRFKIAPALGLFLLFFAASGAEWTGETWLSFALVAVSIATAAAYTSLSNDLFDIQSDAAAGKHNRLAHLSTTQRLIIIGATAGVGLGCTWAMPSTTARLLYFALWVNWTLYSAPPVRTKNRWRPTRRRAPPGLDRKSVV